MKYNYGYLKALINVVCGSNEVFASVMGMTPDALKRKLDSVEPWTAAEIEHATNVLNIPVQSIQPAFFTLV